MEYLLKYNTEIPRTVSSTDDFNRFRIWGCGYREIPVIPCLKSGGTLFWCNIAFFFLHAWFLNMANFDAISQSEELKKVLDDNELTSW